MVNRIHLSGTEFIDKILSGERDFRAIKLTKNSRLDSDQEKYWLLCYYLRNASLSEDPLNLCDADLTGLTAKLVYKDDGSSFGLFFPYVNAERVNLKNAILPRSVWNHSNLREAKLIRSKLTGSKFINAHLDHVIATEAMLDGMLAHNSNWDHAKMNSIRARHANFNNSSLLHAKLYYADLRYANFANSVLEHAKFRGAKLYGTKFPNIHLYYAINAGAKSLGHANFFDKTKISRVTLQIALNRQEAVEKLWDEIDEDTDLIKIADRALELQKLARNASEISQEQRNQENFERRLRTGAYRNNSERRCK